MGLKATVARLAKCITVRFFARKNGIQTGSIDISTKAIYGTGIRIGKNVCIDDNTSIGDYTYINQHSSVEFCTIGKYCSISEGVKINPVEHNSSLISTHPVVGENGHYGLERKCVTIGNDVLISINAVILGGVSIGDGAVIGAGAVVTHDVKPYEIVGGVPSKHIRFRFDSEKRTFLEGLRWWDWPEDKIQRNLAFFRNETDQIED